MNRLVYSEYITLRSEYEEKLQNILKSLIVSWIITVKDPELYIKDKQHHRKYRPYYREDLKGYLIVQESCSRVRYSQNWGVVTAIRGHDHLLPYGNQILDLNLEYYLKYCEFFSTKLFKCPDLEERKQVLNEVVLDFGLSQGTYKTIYKDINTIRYYSSLPDPDFKATWRDKKDPMRHIKNIVPTYAVIESKNDLRDPWTSFRKNSLRLTFGDFFPLLSPNHVVIIGS